MTLVSQAAKEVNTPMPYLSILVDRFLTAKAKGRSGFDWSAIGLNAAEDAGIDISEDLKRNDKDVKENNKYK